MIKLTPRKVINARKHPMIIKWRASGRSGTVTTNPLFSERVMHAEYQKRCQSYIVLMLNQILSKEENSFGYPLQLRSKEYYHKRYDVTDVECTILREHILSKLKH